MTPHTKAEVRSRIRALRASISAPERAALAESAALEALKLPQVRAARYVLGFVSSAEEIDIAPLLAALGDRGALIALPRIAGPDELTLHVAGPGLESGPFGIQQPTADQPQVDAEHIDLVIVPGVAFDRSGARIGFGAGYYDRLLPQLPRAFRIALAYDFQVVESLPVEAHDVPVGAIVTPDRTLIVHG